MALPEPLSHYVGGGYVDPGGAETFPNLDPATGAVIGSVVRGTAADVGRAVASARAGFETWRATGGAARARVLVEAARLLRARTDDLAATEVADTGKPIAEATSVDVHSGADCLEYFAGVAATLHGEYVDLGGSWAYTRREPLGVCAGIGAWNYPLQIACWKSAPALAGGNAMVFKPAELTPRTAALLAEIYHEAGLPDGVFNVVQGDASTGRSLTAHPGVAKVSLTGEVGTGRAVMAQAAPTLKHVTLELGGKSPFIVFADADLDQTVSAALVANFFTQGEICSNGTRVFLHEDVHDAVVDRIVARVRAMRVGDPRDPRTQVGALISAEHRDRVLGYLDSARRDGATVRCGGGPPPDPGLAAGCYVAPTVLTGCHDDMTVVREEVFGPVMAVLRFTDEDEVVDRANASEYGLAAGVFTRDLVRAHRVAARLEAGTVWINTYNLTPVEVPFGGTKQSGLGRENGIAAIDHYTQRKTVYVEMGGVDAPF